MTWSGLEKIEFIKEKFKSFKFSHNAKGQRSMSYQDNQLLKTDYSLLFSPLIKLTARSKGKIQLILKLDQNIILIFFLKVAQLNMTLILSYGERLSIVETAGCIFPSFFRDLDLKNTVSFSFSTDFDFSRKLVGYQQVDNISELTLDDSSSKFSLTPK